MDLATRNDGNEESRKTTASMYQSHSTRSHRGVSICRSVVLDGYAWASKAEQLFRRLVEMSFAG
jgi:hypothetical protein